MDDGRLLVEQPGLIPCFGQLFDRHYDDIYKYILHRTANAELPGLDLRNLFQSAA